MKKLLFFVTFAVLIFSSFYTYALNTQGLRYYFAGGRALSLIESKPAPRDTLTTGFGFNYAYRPLEVGNAGGARVSGVVDHLVTFDLMGGYSFTDRIAVGVNIPIHYTKNLATLAGTAMESKFNLGDVLLTGVFNLVDPGENAMNAGFSVAPFVTLPSGKSSNYVGEANVTGGVLFVGDIDINGHYLGLNLGCRLRKNENLLNLSVGHEFMYTLAYHHAISEPWGLSGFAELGGLTVLKDFWQKANSSPFEIRGGLTKTFMDQEQLKVTLGTGAGFGNGYSSPDVRGLLKVTYDYIVAHQPKPEPVTMTRLERIEKELKELTIYFPTDGSQVDPYYDSKIAGIAKIIRDNPDLAPLYIISHTDDVGTDAYNQTLSERRSKQAYDSIVASGLDPRMIVSTGMGEKFPVVENSSDANRALNRRTLFTFIKPDQLQQKQTKQGVVGYNVLTGKQNDSYTEVLKELDMKQQDAVPGTKAVVVKQYKDSSSVIVDDGTAPAIKTSPTSEPQQVDIKPRSKKYYETTPGGTTIVRDKKDKTPKQADEVSEETLLENE